MFRHLTRCNSKGALGRLSSTNLRELQSWPLKRHDFHLVVTLDPNRFSEKKQKPFNIGDLTCFKPYIALHNHWSPVKVFTGLYYCRRKMSTSLLEKLPTFPPDTKAFLYYFRPPDRPLIAGELRLRVTSSDDPASFESGSDLLGINYRPWSRPLFLVSKYNIPLYEKLREELLVSDKLDAILSTFPKKRLGGQYHLQHHRSSQLLYRLNDTFIIDFSYFLRQLTVITEQGMETMKFSSHISETRPKQWTPYTGSALVRFERSTLPNHKGTRTVVLRFLRIITPVKCVVDGHIVQPKEGELHRRLPKGKGIKDTNKFDQNQLVWSVNIDEPKGRLIPCLRLLWDA